MMRERSALEGSVETETLNRLLARLAKGGGDRQIYGGDSSADIKRGRRMRG